MTNKQLNKMLITAFPELAHLYQDEVTWQETEEISPHVMYGTLFIPYIENCFENNNVAKLHKIFDFIEQAINTDDKSIVNVMEVTVLEGIDYILIEQPKFFDLLGEHSKKAVLEMRKWDEENS